MCWHCFKQGTVLQKLAGLCTESKGKKENSQMKGLIGLKKLATSETHTENKILKGFKYKDPIRCLS